MKLSRALLAEFLGTAALLLVVVGSGIMGENLSQGNAALALLANSLATGAGLFVLIQIFQPISGAHFNPVVSLTDALERRLPLAHFFQYFAVQVAGAVTGVFFTHLIFGKPILQLSAHDRSEFRYFVSEFAATLGLLLTIRLTGRQSPRTVPAAVALYITSAYWFTSSTSFANPAVTLARSLTDSFAGIHWAGVPGFILAQILGALAALALGRIWAEES